MIKITLEFLSVEDAQDFLIQNAMNLRSPIGGPGHADEKEEAPEETEKPKSRRRGRGPAKKKEEEEKPAGRRRGRGPAKEEKEAPESSKEEADISDAEASKAASEAAKELTVQVVLDELHEYKVEKVSELDQSQRKEFVERLRDLLNTPEGKDKAW